MNPMHTKTPEERKAIAAKGRATRRARREAEDAARRDARAYASDLRQQIAELEQRLAALRRMETLNAASAAITGSTLLRVDEIAQAALPWNRASGVYFLLDGNDVVYVGQSKNVYTRISEHADKQFDRYAFVPCPVESLDVLESLYIHCLRPRLNGTQRDGASLAPVNLKSLLRIASSTARKSPAPGAHPPAASSCSAAGAPRSDVRSPAQPARSGSRPRTAG